MTCFIAICSKEYLPHYQILFDSLKPYGYDQILYHIGDVSEFFDKKQDITQWYNEAAYSDTLTKICSLRARVVLDAFDKGYSKVVFLGAKVEFFSNPHLILQLLDKHDAVATPHILEPLPEDGKYPSNASVSFTGHLSTDVVAFKNTAQIKTFLTWQDAIMQTKCATTQHTYLDQSWLNFLPYFVDNVYTLRHAGYNVGYWNMYQRGLKNIAEYWWVGEHTPLVCFQFSGIEKGNETQISRHQNRWIAEGDILDFLQSYTSKL